METPDESARFHRIRFLRIRRTKRLIDGAMTAIVVILAVLFLNPGCEKPVAADYQLGRVFTGALGAGAVMLTLLGWLNEVPVMFQIGCATLMLLFLAKLATRSALARTCAHCGRPGQRGPHCENCGR